MALCDLSLHHFLDRLASASPTPGGGSVAALAAAMAASLLGMVSRITLAREDHGAVHAQVRETLQAAEGLRLRLEALAQEDADSYDGVMAAYRLPRQTEEMRERRGASIQEAVARATEVPAEVAWASAQVLRLCRPAGETTVRSALGDVAVAAVLADAALLGAAAQARINLRSLKDPALVERLSARLAEAEEDRAAATGRALSVVEGRTTA